MNPIQTAIQKLGGPAKAAEVLDCSVQAVCFYRDGKRRFPAELCPVVERHLVGAVTCEELRPDVDWQYLRGTQKAA